MPGSRSLSLHSFPSTTIEFEFSFLIFNFRTSLLDSQNEKLKIRCVIPVIESISELRFIIAIVPQNPFGTKYFKMIQLNLLISLVEFYLCVYVGDKR